MNARTPLAEPSVELIPLDAIWPSQTQVQQLRRKRFNAAAIDELAASMQKAGQLQPILVRPRPPVMIEGRKFEIVLGERRFLAAQKAGFAHIQASVRELEDGDVLEAQLIENLQREDLHPLEEAEGYRELMKAADLKKEELGGRLGKSRSWVYSRLQLLDLLPEARAALEAGEIDVSRALVLAAIGDPAHQAKALKLASERTWDGKNYAYSVRALKEALGDKGFTVSLKAAPFDMLDTTLVDKKADACLPACGECPFRAGNHDPEAEDPDVCTNRSCYEKKVQAHGKRALAQAEAEGRPVLRGDEAKKVAWGRGMDKDKLAGFVDLNMPCDFDEYPEPEPERREDETDEAFDQREEEWNERYNAFQPRTYRQLLAGQSYEVTLLEEGKKVRELVPFKQAQALLKKTADIKLPSHIAAPAPKRTAQPRVDYKAQQEEYERQRKEREEKAAKERAWRAAVLEACAEALKPGELKGEALEFAFKTVAGNWACREGFKALPARIRNAKKTDATYTLALRLAPAAACVGELQAGTGALLALAKACKVDIAKIKKQLAQDAEKPKGETKTITVHKRK